MIVIYYPAPLIGMIQYPWICVLLAALKKGKTAPERCRDAQPHRFI